MVEELVQMEQVKILAVELLAVVEVVEEHLSREETICLR